MGGRRNVLYLSLRVNVERCCPPAAQRLGAHVIECVGAGKLVPCHFPHEKVAQVVLHGFRSDLALQERVEASFAGDQAWIHFDLIDR